MPGRTEPSLETIVDRLADLYERPFGGKPRGRYRVSMKLMCALFGRRRVWPDQIEALRRALYERGYVLVDLESYFVVVAVQTFASYRRVNEEGIGVPAPAKTRGRAGAAAKKADA